MYQYKKNNRMKVENSVSNKFDLKSKLFEKPHSLLRFTYKMPNDTKNPFDDVRIHFNSEKPVQLWEETDTQRNQTGYMNGHLVNTDVCIQAMWKKSPIFKADVYVNNEYKKKSCSERLYIMRSGELYVNGKKVFINSEEKEALEKEIEQDMTPVDGVHNEGEEESGSFLIVGEQNKTEEMGGVKKEGGLRISSIENSKSDFELDYFKHLDQVSELLCGNDAQGRNAFDVVKFYEIVEAEAVKRTKEFLRERYIEACEGIQRLKIYGRKGGSRYKELIEDRARYLKEYKLCGKPMSSIYREVEKELCNSAQERVSLEKKKVWENIQYKNQMMMPIEESSIVTQTNKKLMNTSTIEQTREKLKAQSLLVLPSGLPLAGIFPDKESKEIKKYKEIFGELDKHAENLIAKYKLYHGNGGVIIKEEGCVCIMYLKVDNGDTWCYKPAFGISGFFSGQGETGVKNGFKAMGIPDDLLNAEDKPTALKGYLSQCKLLGLRVPSMQACLSYLQYSKEYGNIERWKPIMCAEPAIVMAIHNLYPDTAELVLSYPFHGKLLNDKPAPKYTCGRCAVAEKAFGAVEKPEDSIIRKQVEMGIENPERMRILLSDKFIRNTYNNSSESTEMAYKEDEGVKKKHADKSLWKENQILRFLQKTTLQGFYHGSNMLKNIQEVVISICSSATNRSPQCLDPKCSKKMQDGKHYAEIIQDDQGKRIQIIDSPSEGNNCFFVALKNATGDNPKIDIGLIRERLREEIGDESNFKDGEMVNERDFAALTPKIIKEVLGIEGFSIHIYGKSGLLQKVDYGTVDANTPIIVNLRFNHYVAKVK